MEGYGAVRLMKFAWSVVWLVLDSIRMAFSNLIPGKFKTKKDVRNETVLITGGGSGFGQLLAVKFAQLGCRVVIWDVDEPGCRETARRVKRTAVGSFKVHSYIVDVSDRVKVYETAKKVKMEVGEVTILVNNAGIAHSNYFLDTPDCLLEKVMNVNALAHFWTLKAFLPSMAEKNHGHLVTVASAAGLMASQRTSAYSASKHAAIGFLDSVALDLIESGKTNVKTTVVCPFFSTTPLFQSKYDGLMPIVEAEVVADRIMEGILTEKEVVYVPRSAFIFGLLKVLARKQPTYNMCRIAVGDSLLNTIKVRSVFEEQRVAA